jgi:dUTPase
VQEELSENLKADFLARENEISLMSQTVYSPCCTSCEPCTVRYALSEQASIHPPELTSDKTKIILSATDKVTVSPQDIVVHDLGVHLQIPEGYTAVLTPVHPQVSASLYSHTGITSEDLGFSLKIFLKNTGEVPLAISPGCQIVYVKLTKANRHNQDEKQKQQCSHSAAAIKLQLSELHKSMLSEFLTKHSPSRIRPLTLPCCIQLPEEQDDKFSVLANVGSMDDYEHKNIQRECAMAFHNADYANSCNVDSFTTQLIARSAQLNSQKVESINSVPKGAENTQTLKAAILTEMCEKLAVINLDLIKNKSLSRNIFSRAQQSDDYLSSIYHSVLQGSEDFPNFFVKDSVLYKRIFEKTLGQTKYVICLPDELLPSVIHTLHTTLGHPSVTATVKNFRAYYFNRQANRCIKDYVHSCITCSYAGKYDLRKVRPSTVRTLRPTRPRQHMYCDLIPMPKGQFSYILFCLDAYSQYVYAVPLRDKSANSVLQGFLQIFSTVGWYEALYLDNETSFVKVAQLLVRLAPIAIHYSTPYCHQQNNAENYIKSFKRNFLKVLNDSENPQDNKDWALCLPTVTQSLNRQVIQALGLSRDTVHYNCPTQYYPLAELSAEDNADLQKHFDDAGPNVYDAMKAVRDKATSKSTKAKVPTLSIGQLVFVIDSTPSAPGVSSVLKAPTKGPFRIENLESRNVKLVDIEDGKIFHSHVELLRPLSLKQYKTLLTKQWDFNNHFTKQAKSSMMTRSAFDRAMDPLSKEEILQSEGLLDLHDLYGADNDIHDIPDTPDSTPVEPDGDPPDPPTDQPEADSVDDLEYNSYKVSDEVSKIYRESLDLKKEKTSQKKLSFSMKIIKYFQK